MVKMTDEEVTLHAIRCAIAALPEDQKQRIREKALRIKEIADDEDGFLALTWVGAERAAVPAEEGPRG